MGGEAADELVRIVLNGTEVAIKLTGSAAKNLAALLIAWSKKEKKVYGKTTMMKLLRSGDELQVLSLNREQYAQFKEMARKKVLYAPFLNTKSDDGKVDVVISGKSVPLVNFILKKIGYGEVEKEPEHPEESKKKDTPSRQSSADVKVRSEVRVSTAQDSPTIRESVAAKLEQNRQYLNSKAQSGSDRTRSKAKGKPKSKER